jgi:hypothetical protein
MIENTILSGLVFNEDYTRRVLPFIRDDTLTTKRIVWFSRKSTVT